MWTQTHTTGDNFREETDAGVPGHPSVDLLTKTRAHGERFRPTPSPKHRGWHRLPRDPLNTPPTTCDSHTFPPHPARRSWRVHVSIANVIQAWPTHDLTPSQQHELMPPSSFESCVSTRSGSLPLARPASSAEYIQIVQALPKLALVDKSWPKLPPNVQTAQVRPNFAPHTGQCRAKVGPSLPKHWPA